MAELANLPSLMIVDWQSGTLMPAPRKDRPTRRETFYRATCGQCGGERWLRKSDAKRECCCRKCHTSAAGKKGYQATVARHGADFALRFVQQYRLDHPSLPEREVINILETEKPHEVEIEREHRFDGANRSYLLDMVIKVQGQVVAAIEVDGYYHYSKERTQTRDRQLESEWALPLLRVNASQINRQQIVGFVKQAQMSAVAF